LSSIEEEDKDQPIARDQWFTRGRTIPGKSAATLRYRAHLRKMQMRAARSRYDGRGLGAGADAAWIPLGPAPLASDASGVGQQDYNWVSGRATAVAVDPADATGNTVYLGGAYGGVWKSTNAGPLSLSPSSAIWVPLTDNQATLAVGAIAIQPQLSNPDPRKSVVLVGTGETNSSGDSYYGLGILRSSDAGVNWTLITQSADSPAPRSFQGLGFSHIAFSASNPQLAVAGAAAAVEGIVENLENPPLVNRGIYYSGSGGASWKYASVKDVNTAVDPSSATAVIFNAAVGRFYAAVRYHGFYASSDGVNWSRLPNQPGGGLSAQFCPPSPSLSSCPIYRGELTVVPGRNEMYVWYVDANESDQGIYKTTDGGISWTTISTAGIEHCGDAFGCGTEQGFYNLELLAVPDGTVTDLYAGAINLYKCTITGNQPNCSGSGSNAFINLTHAYGCSSIARVHPDQHGLDSMVANERDIMYFANDGGIYRTLDAYTGLTAGTCGLTNQFDSLNQTLGSMTQFVSFAQHPNDADTILGGTQDNGSPATASSQTSSQWFNVNAGDGGYNAINPHNTDEWFTANTGVSIQRCTQGIGCHSGDFVPVVQPANLGSDRGAFYTPYLLDPQSETSELIVGTCRVWRGPGSGGPFVQLSVNFETGSPTGACTGEETNLVRSLAAGGPKDDNGLSKSIYASTDGWGPQIAVTPPGGHVWTTTNAAGGILTWFDRTGSINPLHFPISSIAVDSSDTLGLTAYVTIMGFGVSHVWKTTNAGSTWSDFTGNLPDAPANAVVVDPGPSPDGGVVYVGTDVGVFFSGTSTPAWAEVGPAPDGGQAGFLPNVAVTALRIFDIGTTKLLRASTYGRGVWQFPLTTSPDFAISLAHPSQTVFPGQIATTDGTLTAFNSYNSSVVLSCVTGPTPPPATCKLNPANVTPTPSGASFTLTEGGVVGDYRFNLRGVGSDSGGTTHEVAATLHVVDFGLTAPSPSDTTANRPGNSDPVSFQVTAAGSFNGSVSLSCSGLPAGATCNFSPAGAVNPTAQSPVTITLIISTGSGTPPGTFPITIAANTSGAPSAKNQLLSLTVTALADYELMLNPAPSNSPVNQAVLVQGTVRAFNGYASEVTLSCGAGQTSPPPTCTFNPVSIVPSDAGTPFTLTLNSGAPGNYFFSAKATGADDAGTVHTAVVSLTFFDFDLTVGTATQTITAGQRALYSLDLVPLGLSTFHDAVTYRCSAGLPLLSSCSFAPAQVSAGAGETSLTLSVQTTAPIARMRLSPSSSWRYAVWMAFPSLLLGFVCIGRAGMRKRLTIYARLAFLLAGGLALTACGGGGVGGAQGGGAQPGTTPGTYTITVEASSGALSQSKTIILTVQ